MKKNLIETLKEENRRFAKMMGAKENLTTQEAIVEPLLLFSAIGVLPSLLSGGDR